MERKIFRPEQVDEILSRIQGTTDLTEIKDCDLVIEAVFEDLAVKKDLFSRLDQGMWTPYDFGHQHLFLLD